jgi:PAS domain S-box-containing protein
MQEQTRTPSRIGEDRIREAFEYAASGMAITDLDGRFQETNPAYREIVARTQQELESETILSITDPEDRQKCQNHLESLVSGERASFVLEKRYVRPDGCAVWVRNSFSLLKDEQGQPSHVILVCNDITERRRAERMFAETEKLVVAGQLSASIAHEINNPVEAVLNLLYLLRGAESLDQAHEFAARAEEQVQRVAEIATNTLRFHKHQTNPTPTNIAQLLESVLLMFQGKLVAAKVDVHLQKDGEPNLVCYSGEMRQVLANLILNAVEAMPKGGRLRLRVKSASDWRTGVPGVRVTVADNGLGMNALTRRHIYDAFFTTKGTLGTGLGLWVTAGIIAKHGGSMHLRSSDLVGASGTVFTLIFPCVLGEAAELAELP